MCFFPRKLRDSTWRHMADGGEIGDLIETHSEARFEWRIRDFMKLPKIVDICYTSPYFTLTDSSWFLSIYPNGLRKHESVGWIGLYLHRGDSGPPKTVQYTLGIKRADGTEEDMFTETMGIRERGAGWGVPDFIARLTVKRRISELVPSNALTVICRVKTNERHSLQGGRFITCGSQTEDVSDITAPKDVSQKEDSAFFDTKGAIILAEHLKDLLIAGQDQDIKIKVKDKEFRAHKNILRARSPVFAKMFSHDMEENNTNSINIEDCDPEVFDGFLLHVYSGKTENLTLSNAASLYYVADKYGFPVLKERCVSYLKTALTARAICSVIHLAARHGEKELLETAMDFFTQNIEEIVITVEWQRFLRESPDEANELYIKSLKTLLHKS